MVLLVSAWSAPALAQAGDGSPSSDERPSAEALLERGVALRAEGRDAEALEVFRRAWEEERTARVLAQIALAEQALGRWVEAGRHLEEALRRDDDWVARHRDALELSREAIHAQVVRVRVSGPAGAEVRLDGEPSGTLPLEAPLLVAAGAATRISVHLDGGSSEETVTASGGSVRTVELVPATPAEPPPPEDAPLTDRAPEEAVAGAPWLAVSLVSFGVGASGLGLALPFHVERERHAAEWNGCWTATETRAERCPESRDAALTNEAVAAAMLGVGLAALAAGAVFLVLDASARGDEPQAPALACGGTLAGLRCRGRF